MYKHILIGKNIKQWFISYWIICLFVYWIITPFAFAGPTSTTYEIREYGFGSGGTTSDTSTTYKLFGLTGENAASVSSTTFTLGAGLTYTVVASTPAIPTFTNPGSNYDRLKFVINTSNNPSDTKYAIAISTDNFVADTRYIKSDNTIGTTLTSADYQTYTTWGGASGAYVTGLSQNTTYYIKVKALQGNFTETPYSMSASATTSTPSLTFSVSSSTVTFNNLNAGNSFTDNSQTTVLTTSTNAYNGYVINASESAALSSGATTIPNYGSPNSAPTTWSGTGFGYTTSDNDLIGGTNNRFANGTKYAGFQTTFGDPVADHAGPVLSAISNEQFTITYRVTTTNTQKAARYTTTLLYIIVPSY